MYKRSNIMKDKTLYEVLEVSENASAEIIEKAYKVLAKKYHPDLQSPGDKQNAENKMKQINEAYEILGNEEKRREYDRQLQQEREEAKIEQEERLKNQTQNDFYNANSNNYNNSEREIYEDKLQKEEELQRKEMQEKLDKEYENAYYDYLKSLGYKVKHRWAKENFKDILIVIIIMAIIITALWFIPPSHDWIVNFYEQNPIIKAIVDIVIGIIAGIFSGIWRFITGLFSH